MRRKISGILTNIGTKYFPYADYSLCAYQISKFSTNRMIVSEPSAPQQGYGQEWFHDPSPGGEGRPQAGVRFRSKEKYLLTIGPGKAMNLR